MNEAVAPPVKPHVLVVGPGGKSQGGITAVIRNYSKTEYWTEFNCIHHSSVEDGAGPRKLAYILYQYVSFICTVITSRPTVVALHAASGNSFVRKFAYLLIARALGIPIVLHIHPAEFLRYYRHGSGLIRWMVRFSASSSARIVFLSELQLLALSDIYPVEKSVVISNPVDVQAHGVWGPDWIRQPRQVIFLGWLVPEKGIYDIVDAMPDVLKKFPDAKFVFAGPKDASALVAYIADRGLDGAGCVVGWISGETRLRLLRTSRVLILPSYTEGVPNVILEAMAARVPVITTPVGGIPSVIEDGVNGIFVQPHYAAGIAEAVCRVLGEDEECERLAENAYKDICSKYDLGVISDRLRDLYGSVSRC